MPQPDLPLLQVMTDLQYSSQQNKGAKLLLLVQCSCTVILQNPEAVDASGKSIKRSNIHLLLLETQMSILLPPLVLQKEKMSSWFLSFGSKTLWSQLGCGWEGGWHCSE